MSDTEPGPRVARPVDYEPLFRRSQGLLMRLLLSRGAVWAAVQQDLALREELDAQLGALERLGSRGPGGAPPRLLLGCAAKMTEINGDAWRSDPDLIKVSAFDGDEFVVKFPDLDSDSTYYFRIRDGEIDVLLIE